MGRLLWNIGVCTRYLSNRHTDAVDGGLGAMATAGKFELPLAEHKLTNHFRGNLILLSAIIVPIWAGRSISIAPITASTMAIIMII